VTSSLIHFLFRFRAYQKKTIHKNKGKSLFNSSQFTSKLEYSYQAILDVKRLSQRSSTNTVNTVEHKYQSDDLETHNSDAKYHIISIFNIGMISGEAI
jgi:hypothetical protein